jgi:hypothetical protein
MKALNAKERNSAILRFSLWLLVCILVISVPLYFLVILPGEKRKIVNEACQEELSELKREVQYERDTLAVRIGKINQLINTKGADNSDIDAFNAELLTIVNAIEADTLKNTDWHKELYKDLSAISRNLIKSNKIIINSNNTNASQSDKLRDIQLEFQTIQETVTRLSKAKSKNSLQGGLVKVSQDLNKAIRKLDGLK